VTTAPWFWIVFGLAVVFALGGIAFLLLRGEKLGSLSLPARVQLQMRTTTLTIARESGGAGPPRMQLRVRLPMMFFIQRIGAGDAAELATLLEDAANRLRTP
jgi:hypothetical protein